jgi:hypothetical protein
MNTPYPQRWHTCALCRESTQHAVCGNRLLSRWDIMRLPDDHPPVHSWRCAAHRRYTMREASAIWGTEEGDLKEAIEIVKPLNGQLTPARPTLLGSNNS